MKLPIVDLLKYEGAMVASCYYDRQDEPFLEPWHRKS
jgi:hypothetical protein